MSAANAISDALRSDTRRTTGFVLPGFPSMGAWVSYGLGRLTDNLPVFVVLPDVPVQDQPWSRAPEVNLLPDRLVLILEAGGQRIERLAGLIEDTVRIQQLVETGAKARRGDDRNLR